MGRFLRAADYLRQIHTDNLNQIIENQQQILIECELAAQTEMTSYLSKRYDVSAIFTDTTVFDVSANYTAGDRFEYTPSDYNPSTTYNSGDRVTYQGGLYECIQAATTGINPKVTNNWTYKQLSGLLYYIDYPSPLWDMDTEYSAAEQVFYQGHQYTATQTVPAGTLPTATNYWTDNGAYTVTGLDPLTDSEFVKADNRNQLLVTFLIDMTLYHVHSRLSPRQIPEHRRIRYDGDSSEQKGGAIGWLKQVAASKINADLPELTPRQGVSITYGSSAAKQTNTF